MKQNSYSNIYYKIKQLSQYLFISKIRIEIKRLLESVFLS